MKGTILLLVLLLLIGCVDAGSPEAAGEFAIYTLQDPTIDAREAMSIPIEDLPLKLTPFLTSADLKSYSWSTHRLELRPEFAARWEDFKRNGGSVSGVPFVVTVGRTRIYAGTFWWAYSSMMPPACAVVEVLGPGPYVAIRVESGTADYRHDHRVLVALQRAGVLTD